MDITYNLTSCCCQPNPFEEIVIPYSQQFAEIHPFILIRMATDEWCVQISESLLSVVLPISRLVMNHARLVIEKALI